MLISSSPRRDFLKSSLIRSCLLGSDIWGWVGLDWDEVGEDRSVFIGPLMRGGFAQRA